jgi:hypothetical protein
MSSSCRDITAKDLVPVASQEVLLLVGSSGELLGFVLGPGLEVGLGLLESSLESKLGGDAFDAMGRVDVLHQDNLVASGSALARCNGRPSEEEEPDLRGLS